jgi:hypothetical protein
MKLTPDEKRELRAVFPDRPDSACGDCQGYHLRFCPRVKLQKWIGEGAGTGSRIEVEYWPDGQYDDSNTIYPEDVYDPDDEE